MASNSKKAQVLAKLKDAGPCTLEDLTEKLPDLRVSQVRTALRALRREKLVDIDGVAPKKVEGPGRVPCVFKISGGRRQVPPRSKSQSHKEPLTNLRRGARVPKPVVVTMLDKKIDLLHRLIDRAGGHDKDLLINMLRDYGAGYEGER